MIDFEILSKGGIISWILLVMSILTLGLIFVKAIQFANLRLRNIKFIGVALEHIKHGNIDTAKKELGMSKNPIAKTMLNTINIGQKHGLNSDAKSSIQALGNIELARMHSLLSWLDTIAHVAPMLGLLGTVVGMIKAFRELAGAGVQVDITMLSTGIWEALITTAIGLIVSVIALIAFNGFSSRVNKTKEVMSVAVSRLIDTLR
jgi:biopolymer transport protein ExbB